MPTDCGHCSRAEDPSFYSCPHIIWTLVESHSLSRNTMHGGLPDRIPNTRGIMPSFATVLDRPPQTPANALQQTTSQKPNLVEQELKLPVGSRVPVLEFLPGKPTRQWHQCVFHIHDTTFFLINVRRIHHQPLDIFQRQGAWDRISIEPSTHLGIPSYRSRLNR